MDPAVATQLVVNEMGKDKAKRAGVRTIQAKVAFHASTHISRDRSLLQISSQTSCIPMIPKDNKPGPSSCSRNEAFSNFKAWKPWGGDELLAFMSAKFSGQAQAAYDTLTITQLTMENVWDQSLYKVPAAPEIILVTTRIVFVIYWLHNDLRQARSPASSLNSQSETQMAQKADRTSIINIPKIFKHEIQEKKVSRKKIIKIFLSPKSHLVGPAK
ncbi:hypothetical protein C8J56DRAFT_886777 [Mycena floridula]|nr:hypothetical protein C8J56DRAFT_886777 [Mycena floridula]